MCSAITCVDMHKLIISKLIVMHLQAFEGTKKEPAARKVEVMVELGIMSAEVAAASTRKKSLKRMQGPHAAADLGSQQDAALDNQNHEMHKALMSRFPIVIKQMFPEKLSDALEQHWEDMSTIPRGIKRLHPTAPGSEQLTKQLKIADDRLQQVAKEVSQPSRPPLVSLESNTTDHARRTQLNWQATPGQSTPAAVAQAPGVPVQSMLQPMRGADYQAMERELQNARKRYVACTDENWVRFHFHAVAQ